MKHRSTRLHLELLEDRTMLSSPGDIEWLRQFGSFSPASAQWGTVDADGSIYFAGQVAGALPGQTGAGDFDCFVRKYDADGNELWTHQFGTTGRDSVQAVAVDASGIYIAGYVRLALPGQTNIGAFDAFVRKYDVNGAIVWTRQFGTVAVDQAASIAVDATGVYVGGYTDGIFGQPTFGAPNAFVRKYDVNGVEVWTRQFASSSSIGGEDPAAHGARVSVSDSGVYVTWARVQVGTNVFVRRYDTNGVESWTRQFAASAGLVSVAGDASGVYMAGSTGQALPGQIHLGDSDAFVRRYDANGNEVWTRQFGTTAGDGAFAVAADAAGVYLAGSTAGTLPGLASAGGTDAFVRSYDANGNERWTRQFGTATSDQAFSVTVDAAGIFVAGVTAGALPGQTNAGGPNVFVRKYDTSVTEAWTRQLGGLNAVTDIARAVDADGNVYVAGEFNGILPGQSPAQFVDMFVRKYDAGGNELWTRQFGTFPFDRVTGIAVDASGVYVAGFVFATLPGQTSAGNKDAFLRKYDAAGGELWTRQFGTSGDDQAAGVAADASGVYITGFTTGAFSGFTNAGADDMFVCKYDAGGNSVWTNQFGSAGSDQALGVAVDVSGVYVAGNTTGALPTQTSAGGQDAFVRAYDAAGSVLWTRQFGNAGTNAATGVAADSTGIYVAGFTGGALPGQTSAGNNDAYVRKYDAAGGALWTRQFGTSGADQANGVSAGPTGVYLAGFVAGVLPGKTSAGGQDAFVRKYDADGGMIWTGQFGTAGTDSALGVNVGASGLYVAGFTTGTFPGQTSIGLEDIVVAKIVDLITNTAPSNLVLNLNASIDENGAATLNGSFTDPDAADTYTVVINWGPGEGTTTLNLATGVTTFSATHEYVDDNPTGTAADVYTISAIVTEPTGNSASGSTSITVSNVAPEVTITGPSSGAVFSVGTPITFTGFFSDTGAADTHSAQWMFDSVPIAGSVTQGNGSGSVSDTYTFNAPGVYSVTLLITDDDGARDTSTVTITVSSVVDITGCVFDDRDNDGAFEPSDGDAGISHVSIQVWDQALATMLAQTITAGDGTYVVNAELAAGNYRIVEVFIESAHGLLDGKETAGSLGGNVDNARDSNVIDIRIVAGALRADGYNFAEIRPSRLQTLAWEDFNNDGLVDFGERAIDGVTIALAGADDRGAPVSLAMTTDEQGIAQILSLRPGNYTLTETQPAGFTDGTDSLGTVNGVVTGNASVNDKFMQVILAKPGSDAVNYNFGERPAPGSLVHVGQTATIGFWNNMNGQSLINSLNGGANAVQLGNWLAATFPNLYGVDAGGNNLAGKTNTQVAAFYTSLFERNSQSNPGGPPKVDAQVLAVAFAVYVTNVNLASSTAAAYGFHVTANGLGTSTFTVGASGAAFGVANDKTMTVLDLLLATNARTKGGLLYDLDASGSVDSFERSLREMANSTFTAINEQGDI